MNDTRAVELVSISGPTFRGSFTLADECPDDPEKVCLELTFAGEILSATADTYFDALADIRRTLDRRGLRPKCFGASRDVFPSPMIRSMGTGEMAYWLVLGRQGGSSDLVSIFSTAPEIVPASVEEQEQFYREWLASLP